MSVQSPLPSRDERPLTRSHVPVQVQAVDLPERIVAVVSDELRFNASTLTRFEPTAAVEDLPLIKHDGLLQTAHLMSSDSATNSASVIAGRSVRTGESRSSSWNLGAECSRLGFLVRVKGSVVFEEGRPLKADPLLLSWKGDMVSPVIARFVTSTGDMVSPVRRFAEQFVG